MKKVDFITTFGQRNSEGVTRKEMGLKGGGPDYLVTNLGVFDFDPKQLKLRLIHYHPGVTIEEIQDNTEFEILIRDDCCETPLPSREEIKIIRELDPLEIRKREFTEAELNRKFYFYDGPEKCNEITGSWPLRHTYCKIYK